MARQYHQGKYTCTNPHKYIGNAAEICFRSSWEKRCMIWFDNTPSILKWGSEEIIIPYISPVDNRPHRYFPDFAVKYKKKDGSVKFAIIEVKPEIQTQVPKQPKRMTKQFMESVETYAINTSKWIAARKFCESKDMDFIILTEKDIGVK